jgi:FAD/FMN-containing dehydrogenase
LTGLITWAELQLRPVTSPWFDVETIRIDNLDQFFALETGDRPLVLRDGTSGLSPVSEYTVAWIDSLARGDAVGRGVFMRANHAAGAPAASEPGASRWSIPFDFPAGTLNRHSVGLFNALYRSRASREWRPTRRHFTKYLFPLDGIARWNRMYGARGFFQHQSVVPRAEAAAKIREMLAAVAASGEASFLTVLKVFGDREPAGLLSFARPGVTLALDFPMRGGSTLALLERLDAVVRDAGGAIYPAKDARMSAETFRAGFPEWKVFERHIDPAFSSSFWRRVTAR